MTQEETTAAEGAILAACRAAVLALAPTLAERGLECELPELAAHSSDRYCSEVRAMISRDGQIVDVLEFLVFEDGHPAITTGAAERYTREVLLDALANK
jgi:hypothetical protein